MSRSPEIWTKSKQDEMRERNKTEMTQQKRALIMKKHHKTRRKHISMLMSFISKLFRSVVQSNQIKILMLRRPPLMNPIEGLRYVCLFRYLCIYIYIYIYIHMHIFVVCIYVSMHLCIYVFVHVCMH